MTTETLNYLVTAQYSQLKALQGQVAAMNGTMAKGVKPTRNFGRSVQGLHAPARTGGILVAALGALSFKAAAEFERSLNVMQAVTGATTGEMELARKKAVELGQDLKLPGVSAQDAADAMVQLGKGGFDATQGMEAARGVLLLANAANIDYEASATLVARSLKAFNLEASDAEAIVDDLAAASLKSTVSMIEIADGMRYAGASASALGINFQDTATALAILNDAGLQGSTAGTSLNRMLIRMAAPTKMASDALRDLGLLVGENNNLFFDAHGNFVGLARATDLLSEATRGLGEKEKIRLLAQAFGVEGMRAALRLTSKGNKKWREYADAVGRTGAAEELAGAQTKGVLGKLEKLINAWDTFLLSLGGFMVLFTPVLEALTSMITVMANHPGVLYPAAAALGVFVLGLWALTAVVGAIIAIGVAGVLGAIAVAAIALIAIGVGLLVLYKRNKTFRDFVQRAWAQIADEVETAKDFMVAAFEKIKEWLPKVQKAFWKAKDAVVEAFGKAKDAVMRFKDFLVHQFGPIVEDVWRTIVAWWEPIASLVGFVVGIAVAYFKRMFKILVSFGPILRIVWTIFKGTFGAIMIIVGGLFTFISNFVRLVMALLRGDWGEAWRLAQKLVVDAVNSIIALVKNFLTMLWNVLKGIWPLVRSVMGTLIGIWKGLAGKAVNVVWNVLKTLVGKGRDVMVAVKNAILRVWLDPQKWLFSKAKQIISGVISGVEEKATDLYNKLVTIKNKIIGKFDGLPGEFAQLGWNLIQGIWNGINARWDQFVAWLQGKVDALPRPLKFVLRVASPSQRFADEIGRPIVEGIALGIMQGTPAVHKALIAATSPQAILPLRSSFSGAALAGAPAGGPMISVDTLVVREETDAERLAAMLSAKLAVRR